MKNDELLKNSEIYQKVNKLIFELPVKPTDIADFTGVPLPVLSRLKHRKRKIENMRLITALKIARYYDVKYYSDSKKDH